MTNSTILSLSLFLSLSLAVSHSCSLYLLAVSLPKHIYTCCLFFL